MLMLNVTDTLTPAEITYTEVEFDLETQASLNGEATQALVLPNDLDLKTLDVDISGFGAVILSFPKFADGRAYSQARLLRERFSFEGKIIARGDVLPDQLLFMKRCGFDGIELQTNDISAYQNALTEFTAFYQPAADDSVPVWARRLRSQRAAA